MAMATDPKTLHIQLSMAQGNALKYEGDKKAAESALALVQKELESLKEENKNLEKKIVENNNLVIKEMTGRQPLEAELNALREERDGLKKERDSLMRVAGDLQSQLKATKEAQPANVTPDQAKKGKEAQSFFDTLRQNKPVETTIPESQVQEMIERAKQDLLAQATAEFDCLKKERDSLMGVAEDLQSQLNAIKEARPANVTPDQAKKGKEMQSFFDTLRQSKPAETTIPESQAQEMIERAKQDLLAQATEEVKGMMHNWDCMMAQKNADLADAHTANGNLYAEIVQLRGLIQSSNDSGAMWLMKEAQICNLMKVKEDLEGESRAARKAHNDLKLDFDYQKIELKEAKELAAQNGAGWQEEKRLRQEADIREAKTYLDMKESWAEMQAHLVNCGQAENRRIVKEGTEVRSTPPNPRRRPQSPPTVEPSPAAAPVRNSDASMPPFRFMPPYNHPPPAVTSKPAKLDTPKTIAKNNTPSIKKRKRQEEEDTSAGEQSPPFFQVFGVVAALGIFGALREMGYLW